MKDGSCRFFYKISINGHQILKRGFKTELDAFKDLSFVLSKEDNYEDIKNLKYYEVCELYKNHLKETLKITYYHKRCSTIDNYLKKYIRNVPLCKLSQYDFDKFRSKIKNTYLKDKNEIILFLQRMFKWIEEYYGYRVSYAFRINRIRDDTVSYAIKEDKKQYVTFELFLSYYYHLDPYYKLLIFQTFSIDWVNTIFEDFVFITIRTIFVYLLNIALLFLLVKKPDDYVVYAILTVVPSGVVCVSNWIYCRRYVHIRLIIPMLLRKHFKPLLILFANTVAISIYVNFDTTMIGWYKGDYYVGIYTVSAKVYHVLKTMLAAVYVVTIPRLSSFIGKPSITICCSFCFSIVSIFLKDKLFINRIIKI